MCIESSWLWLSLGTPQADLLLSDIFCFPDGMYKNFCNYMSMTDDSLSKQQEFFSNIRFLTDGTVASFVRFLFMHYLSSY